MKPEIYTHHHARIVYDADRITEVHDALLCPQYWQQQQAVFGQARGRGNTVFVATPFGRAALREYRRGGWPARVSRDRYLFLGFQRSRPFREFHLLARLFVDGLPVPAPLAARCERHGMYYRGALMTRLLPDTTTLAEWLLNPHHHGEALLECVGRVIRTFHAGGVDHADLNVRNILVNADDQAVYLVDFDRSTYRPGHRVNGDKNIRRLERSVQKLNLSLPGINAGTAWAAIMRGYHGAS
ncbi:MAG: 3-deoxy-D-manno-octulosonic acid kinase [Xanthomonadales bacterium]|nr:3-deoxy-D-manno-octulosonic acid kinase [Xanthomonadales bacterium]